MSTWNAQDLVAIVSPDELEITTRRRDGALRGP